MKTINIERINKELKRVYGISNPNVVKTILKEAGADDMLEAFLVLKELADRTEEPSDEEFLKADEMLEKAIKQATS